MWKQAQDFLNERWKKSLSEANTADQQTVLYKPAEQKTWNTPSPAPVAWQSRPATNAWQKKDTGN